MSKAVPELMSSIDLQPTLKGRLVELRPLRAEHYQELYAVAADPLIWVQHPRPGRYQEREFKAFFNESLESAGALVSTDLHTGDIIGSSRFHTYHENRRQVEIGWTFLARSHWGGAYNGEMKQLMLRHAFGFVDRVVFLVGRQNLRSQRAIEKIGGVRTGASSDADGNDSFVYELTASAYAEIID